MLPTKIHVNWLFGSGEEAKKEMFPSLPPRWLSWISDRADFSHFDLQAIQILPTKFQVSWLFGSLELAKTRLQDGYHSDHGFPNETF